MNNGKRPRNYSIARHLWESGQALVWGSGWSTGTARLLGLQGELGRAEHTVLPAWFPKHAPQLKVAFAADFHAGPTTHPRLLVTTCQALDEANADIVLLGGDFVSYRASNVRPLARMLGQVRARLGRFAVLGNHDHWAGAEFIAAELEGQGVRVLTNSSSTMPPPHDSITICGLDDHSSGNPDAEAAFDRAGAVRILLMHSPSGLLDLRGQDFDVSLSGHTHGGQVVLPGGFPLYVPIGALSRKYVHGRYSLKLPSREATVIVSRGVGCSTVPVRLFAPPEIVDCTLRPGRILT